MPEGADPAQLRQPAFGPPVVGRGCEQLLRFLAQYCARVCPEVLDPILGKPALHLGERVTVLFGMLILIAKPPLPALRLIRSISQHRIERDENQEKGEA